MKVILINVPYMHIYGPDRKAVKSHFPIGLGYIAAVLRDNSHGVILLDPEAEGFNSRGLEDRIRQESPGLVGITSVTPTFVSALKIARIVRKATKAPIVLGGAHASALPELILDTCPEFDIVVVGEGEYTMLELCQFYENGGDLAKIKGIVYRDKGVHHTPSRPWIANLDELPFPARELVDMEHYYEPNAYLSRGKKSATMITSRGCPFNCIFCASHLTLGNKFRFHSAQYVVREMKHLVNEYGIEHIFFKDDTFTFNKLRVKRICELILEKNIKVDITCLSRVDTVSFNMLRLMRKAGFYCLCFGIESGDEVILQRLKKGITLEQSRRALKTANNLGFKTHCSFIIGNPGETKYTILKTIKFAKELNPVIALFYTLVPYPGTEVFEKYLKPQFITAPLWEDFVVSSGSALLDLEHLSRRELKKYLSLAYRSFYLRPRAIFNILKEIKTFSELKRYFQAGLGLLKRLISLAR